MAKRINRCVELLEQDQAIYYDGPHSGHVLTQARMAGAIRSKDAGTDSAGRRLLGIGTRGRILAACRDNGVAFLQGCTADNIIGRIDQGVRVIAGHSEATAIKGRAYQPRKLPV